jgi:hypothetical protein
MKKSISKQHDSLKQRLSISQQRFPGRRVIRFEGVKGKIADNVALYTAREHHAIQIGFTDGTRLHLELDPAFTVRAEYQTVKAGDVRVLKSWTPMKSEK